MDLAIIGQRELTEEQISGIILESLSKLMPSKVISGGSKGVDSIAISISRKLGIETVEFLPVFKSKSRHDVVNGYYERNKKIVNACDLLIAIVGNRKTGGSFYTIKYAKSIGKEVIIYQV